jgi:hypothetical protein
LRKIESVSVLQFLAAFFPWLFHSKEFWAALVGIVGAFIGAIIGGLITGRYALRAQEQAAQDQRQRDQETERRAVNGILRSIAAELLVLKRDNFHPLHTSLIDRYLSREVLRQNNLPQKYLPSAALVRSEQNYFIVFESNAAALSGINDDKLREDIIRAYGHAKGLVDLLSDNSREFELWRSLQEATYDKLLTIDKLERSETTILTGLDAIEPELDELLKQIEKYLSA